MIYTESYGCHVSDPIPYECRKKGGAGTENSPQKTPSFDANILIENGTFCHIMIKIGGTS